MDGLLLDTEPLYQAAWREAAVELGYTLSDRFNRSLIGKSESGSLQMLRNEFGDDFPIPSFISLCGKHWEAQIAQHGIAIKPGAIAVLSLLERESVPFAIATSSHQHNASLSLSVSGLSNRLDTVVTGTRSATENQLPTSTSKRRAGSESIQPVVVRSRIQSRV